ncbi:hypothetical protein K505DRAFT_363570 [Melanomma pulvis-pyrius CBS 109.77]|uniref:Uncharacterized protein n=1 Tax=Melanomma pulvis-pyrius CBS 109.77 TaxID=1314802 RepID=A0A6A6X6M3_9PLEO|nr:hypothetical protein K505DRAFT_363570 [Melanomma pulvis-pyrius CBS 109.77]
MVFQEFDFDNMTPKEMAQLVILHSPKMEALVALSQYHTILRDEKMIVWTQYPFNQELIQEVLWAIGLNRVRDGTDKFSDDDLLSTDYLLSTDNLEVAMSCFPENICPSFRHPSGVSVKLTSDKPPSPPKEEKRSKATGANTGQINNGTWILTVRRIEPKEAVIDLNSMMKEKEARSTSSSVARQMGNFVLSGGNSETIFQKLEACTSRYETQEVSATRR